MLENPEQHVELKGGLSTAHQWLEMSHQKVPLKNGNVGRTCPPALGYAFAAGTSDGPGFVTFRWANEQKKGTQQIENYLWVWPDVAIENTSLTDVSSNSNSTNRQGTNETDPYWAKVVSRVIKIAPSLSQEKCHAPKVLIAFRINNQLFLCIVDNDLKNPCGHFWLQPILISAGELTFPFQWQPTRVDTQMFRIGHVLIAGLPGEFTTMAGR